MTTLRVILYVLRRPLDAWFWLKNGAELDEYDRNKGEAMKMALVRVVERRLQK